MRRDDTHPMERIERPRFEQLEAYSYRHIPERRNVAGWLLALSVIVLIVLIASYIWW